MDDIGRDEQRPPAVQASAATQARTRAAALTDVAVPAPASTSQSDEHRLRYALLLIGSFMLVEVVGGVLSGSLALLADAGHMLTDTAALALAWAAMRAGRRAADARRSYGQHRFQVLAAFINGGALLGVCAWIAIEAVRRLLEPHPVLGTPMLIVAGIGLLVNIGAFLILHGGDRRNLNLRGALLHVIGDMLGSAAAIVAALVILATGWTPIDPLLSIAVTALILRSAYDLIARSWHVLMEGTPEGFDVDALRLALCERVPGVVDVHHVHLWALTPERPVITLHASIDARIDHDTALHGLKAVLARDFELRHATIQVERRGCPDHVRDAPAPAAG